MAKSQTLELIIKAKNVANQELNKVATGIKQAGGAMKAFNREAKLSSFSNLRREISALAGAFAGLQAVRKTVKAIQEADAAAYSLEASVRAANMQFENTGSIKDWNQAVTRLSGNLKIYSDTSLKNAISRTIDMTKRLGMSREQMEKIIETSANLGAGKVDLEGAIERVTAALRGEAESSEYLGLTLNENYVKAWYKANDAHGKAWEKLSDLEKAQIRYNVLLEQSAGMQGRAAGTANTFSGALMLIAKEINNSIVRNKSLIAAMNEAAEAIKENAGNIGKLISMLVKALAWVVSFTVKYKVMLAVIAATAASIAIITKLVAVIKGLNAAMVYMTGTGIVAGIKNLVVWIGSLRTALNAAATASTAAGVALRLSLAAGATYGAVKILQLIKVIYEWRKAVNEVKKIAEQAKEAAETYAHAKDIEVKSAKEFAAMSKEEQAAYKEKLKAAILYWGKMANSIALSGKDASEAEEKFNALTAAIREMLSVSVKSKGTKVPTPSLTDEEIEEMKKLEAQLAEELIKLRGDKYAVLLYQAKKHYEDEIKLAHGNAKLLADAETVYVETVISIYKEKREALLKEEVEAAARQNEAIISRSQESTQTALAMLDNAYNQGMIALEKYFAERRALIEKQYSEEIRLTEESAAKETDPAKKLELETEVFSLREKLTRELLQIDEEAAEKRKELDDQAYSRSQILADLRQRINAEASATLQATFQAELGELDSRHQEEIKKLQDLNATKAELDEAYRMQKLEKDKLILDQERRLYEARMEMAINCASGLESIFSDLYDLSGGKIKEFFYLAKAAAIAEAIMNTSQAVTKALAQGGYLGIAQAVIVAAKGAVEIAKISSQSLAKGGPVLGVSPTEKADDKIIRATSGEFMQPVPAVKYYGVRVMEAIRTLAIPREIFQGISLPQIKQSRPAFALAAGGQVPAGGAGSYSVTVPVNVTGVSNPEKLARILPGEIEATVIRVVREIIR